MGNVSRGVELLRKNKEILKIKNAVTEMKNAFHGLIIRLETPKERISEFEDVSLETSKIEKRREKSLKKIKQSI